MTPVKQNQSDDKFKSPRSSHPSGKQFTPKILIKHQASHLQVNAPKSPTTRNAFWGLSSSAQKIAADNGWQNDAAPWPSPVHTMLRRHVTGLRTQHTNEPR